MHVLEPGDNVNFIEAAAQFEIDAGKALFDLLRRKWSTVPSGQEHRQSMVPLLNLTNEALLENWHQKYKEATEGNGFASRGWYHTLYKDIFAGRRVLELGSGMGLDGIYFASQGAHWHFSDIVENNLKIIEKILQAQDISADGLTYIDSLLCFDKIEGEFDFIYCQGSLLHAPFDVAQVEARHLLLKLKEGGRWVELSYPKERWCREGEYSFEEWGSVTDGDGTPWVEWYDLEKIRKRLYPASIRPVLNINFHSDDFNWFDLEITQRAFRDEKPSNIFGQLVQENEVPLGSLQSKSYKYSKISSTKTDSQYVVTPNDMWGFAACFSLDIEQWITAFSIEPQGAQLLVSIKGHGGHVGVGLINENMADYDCWEKIVAGTGVSTLLCFELDGLPTLLNLMIRQVDGHGAPSEAELLGISIRGTSVGQLEHKK